MGNKPRNSWLRFFQEGGPVDPPEDEPIEFNVWKNLRESIEKDKSIGVNTAGIGAVLDKLESGAPFSDPDIDYGVAGDFSELRNDTTMGIDPTTGAKKELKLEEYALLPVAPMAEVAKVFGWATSTGKYERQNWRKGFPWSWSISAEGRHVSHWRRGLKRDPESGLHPLAHAVAHLLFLMEYEMRGLGTDDRPAEEKDMS